MKINRGHLQFSASLRAKERESLWLSQERQLYRIRVSPKFGIKRCFSSNQRARSFGSSGGFGAELRVLGCSLGPKFEFRTDS